MVNFKHLTDAELKQKLVQQQPALQQDNDNPNVLRHNLNVHQIELEMQYRELRKSQLELETVRDRYADLYDFAPVGYLTFDKKGCIVEINLTAADMLGKPRGLIVGTPFIAYLAPGNSRVFLNHLHDVLDSEDKITQGVKVKNREGTEVGVRLVSIADRQTNGQEKMCRTAMIDVTEFNQAQEMKKIYLEERAHLARLSSMGEMASSIAHEVLQPLCAITTCTDVLRRALLSSVPDQGQDKNKELDDIFDMIISQTDRIGNIVRNIRGFSKKCTVQHAMLDLNTVISHAEKLVSLKATEYDVNLSLSLTETLPPVMGNEIQLEQVVVNLMMNALEELYGAKDADQRQIQVFTERVNNSVQVRVIDTGRGINEETARQMFEPFFSTKAEGVGMGLSICRTIIKAHGGTIQAEPDPDRGAIVYFTLPIAEN